MTTGLRARCDLAQCSFILVGAPPCMLALWATPMLTPIGDTFLVYTAVAMGCGDYSGITWRRNSRGRFAPRAATNRVVCTRSAPTRIHCLARLVSLFIPFFHLSYEGSCTNPCAARARWLQRAVFEAHVKEYLPIVNAHVAAPHRCT